MDRDRMRFIGITKDALTAGPGKRMELFLKGCIRGVINPCPGCFNPSTWEFGGDMKEMTVDEVVSLIHRDAWNRQVTFCGGEPLLQARNLALVCKRLKEIDSSFHIIVYTAYKLENLMNHGIIYHKRAQDSADLLESLDLYSSSKKNDMYYIAFNKDIKELMAHIDLLVDGDYQQSLRLPTKQATMNDGMFIGSSNQRVIDTIKTLEADPHFVFVTADVYQNERNQHKHCKSCGHNLTNRRLTYCSEACQKRFHRHQKQMKSIGL